MAHPKFIHEFTLSTIYLLWAGNWVADHVINPYQLMLLIIVAGLHERRAEKAFRNVQSSNGFDVLGQFSVIGPSVWLRYACCCEEARFAELSLGSHCGTPWRNSPAEP